MSIPNIEHATITINDYGRYNIVMNEGWVFYDLHDYNDMCDDEGNPITAEQYVELHPEAISYSRVFRNVPTTYDFSKIIVVAEEDVPADQIFGNVTPPTEVM